jgi:hypothetical protein
MFMSETPPNSKKPLVLLACWVLLILLPALVAFPSAARAPDIRHIQPGDMIFIYEQNLDLTGLRTGGNVVTVLRKYQEDNPTKALLREVPVPDDTSFSLIPAAFGDMLGIYYAYNATAGTMGSVSVNVPSVSIDAVLANPNHSDSIQGLSIPDDTPIAFKIISVDVGGSYRAGSLYPATVDLVLTTPGGAQLTTIQGLDFSKMNLSGQVFYTDDPGRPGAITLRGMGTGTFSVQAQWRDPASFYNQAPNSNILTFSIGRTTITQMTPTPVITQMTSQTTLPTPVPTTTHPTTPPATATTAVPPTFQATIPPATGTAAPSPTPMPLGAWPAAISLAVAVSLRITSRRGR